ncbi:transposase [Streptomyces sp. SAS_272]|uniref:transposase n=1 Tax=Streptomyces sp. SAS_272 TaxID=3412747 RepID=UPI00403D4FCE
MADAIGLYLAPPGGAVVLSIDEKTQIQALDRTQTVLPVAFAASEQRTADYVRHGTTNLFAALNVTTGEVLGECRQTRNGKDFLAFLKKAVKPHAGKDIHVVLDNLSTHTTPEVKEWLVKNPQVPHAVSPPAEPANTSKQTNAPVAARRVLSPARSVSGQFGRF